MDNEDVHIQNKIVVGKGQETVIHAILQNFESIFAFVSKSFLQGRLSLHLACIILKQILINLCTNMQIVGKLPHIFKLGM